METGDDNTADFSGIVVIAQLAVAFIISFELFFFGIPDGSKLWAVFEYHK